MKPTYTSICPGVRERWHSLDRGRGGTHRCRRRCRAPADGPPLRYDVLSLNAGGAPVAPPGAIAVKPIGRFLPDWKRVTDSLTAGDRVAIVGAGAGGVELALAAAQALPDAIGISLVTRGADIVPELPEPPRRRLATAVSSSRVELVTAFEATSFSADARVLRASDNRELRCNAAFWVTDVAPPDLLTTSNLMLSQALPDGSGCSGYLLVNAQLQSVSHPNVFGAGDCVSLRSDSTPRACRRQASMRCERGRCSRTT